MALWLAKKYELLGEVGRGGLNTVCKARNRQDGRVVALKIINGAGGDDTKVKRFQKGIESARMLNHPWVVGIIDSGLINDNPFYVMEFVRVRLLSDTAQKSGRLPVVRAY